MSLSKQDVARLAGLARIELSEQELETLAPQLDLILDSVAAISQAADADVPPSSHAVAMTNVFRDDVVRPSFPADAMLANAPAREDDRFRVPRILDADAVDTGILDEEA